MTCSIIRWLWHLKYAKAVFAQIPSQLRPLKKSITLINYRKYFKPCCFQAIQAKAHMLNSSNHGGSQAVKLGSDEKWFRRRALGSRWRFLLPESQKNVVCPPLAMCLGGTCQHLEDFLGVSPYRLTVITYPKDPESVARDLYILKPWFLIHKTK